MIPKAIIETITLPDGREITLETGKLAKQADGSVVVKCGGTMLLATIHIEEFNISGSILNAYNS